ncbi:MAG: hypothetical protein AMJ90_10010 [candidate division Zixibacteria bacterium SM23_73_2]|nr:MAG: hypothetical protein AMJ90_10010 [candidate division Zixibacteria bacterium SM23_73_2]
MIGFQKGFGQISFLKIILFSLLILSLFWDLAFSAPEIKVVYPKEGQNIGAYDSTFIFGQVTPGSKLDINGFEVKIYENGAFMAFLPLESGDFCFRLKAEDKSGESFDSVMVFVPHPLSSPPDDTLRIEKGSIKPDKDMVLTSGDLIQLSFRGTPGCWGYFRIDGLTPDLPMSELPPDKDYSSKELKVFGEDEKKEEKDWVKGIYYGSYMVRENDQIDSAKVIFRLTKKLSSLRDFLTFSFPENTVIDSFNNLVSMVDTASGEITLKRYQAPQIIEFSDSTLIARTGPKLGYVLLYQPQGVRVVATGGMGDWVRIKLAEDETAWVERDSVIFLPQGTPVPKSYITHIRTIKTDGGVQVRVPLLQRLPYRVEEEKSGLIFTIYYAVSNTDWVRYDSEDEMIDQIKWSQLKDGVYQLKIDLNQKQIWGYDVFYENKILVLEIKKKPEMKGRLKGLKIAIDAGHSRDPGAVGPTGLSEREVNLQIAEKLKKVLERGGAEVIMTRVGMEHVPLYDRPKKAIEAGCDILISVHNNALPDGINPFFNNGTSTYYYHPHSKPLAKEIQRELVKNLGLPDFGLYHGNLALTRSSQLLAVLVECAFIILPEQEMLLMERRFQEKIADGIYQGILEFLEKTD